MFYVHAFTVADDGYTHHHKTNITHNTRYEALAAAMKMLKLMHDTTKIDIELMTMENKKVVINDVECEGIMLLSIRIPFSFFVPNVMLEKSPIVYNPSLPNPHKIAVVPEC